MVALRHTYTGCTVHNATRASLGTYGNCRNARCTIPERRCPSRTNTSMFLRTPRKQIRQVDLSGAPAYRNHNNTAY
jgi:hypothetical protein